MILIILFILPRLVSRASTSLGSGRLAATSRNCAFGSPTFVLQQPQRRVPRSVRQPTRHPVRVFLAVRSFSEAVMVVFPDWLASLAIGALNRTRPYRFASAESRMAQGAHRRDYGNCRSARLAIRLSAHGTTITGAICQRLIG